MGTYHKIINGLKGAIRFARGESVSARTTHYTDEELAQIRRQILAAKSAADDEANRRRYSLYARNK